MRKNEIINFLKEVKKNYDDLTFNEKPIHKQINKDHEIIVEDILNEKVLLIEYIHGIEVNKTFVEYFEISKNNLEIIYHSILESLKEFFENVKYVWYDETISKIYSIYDNGVSLCVIDSDGFEYSDVEGDFITPFNKVIPITDEVNKTDYIHERKIV